MSLSHTSSQRTTDVEGRLQLLSDALQDVVDPGLDVIPSEVEQLPSERGQFVVTSGVSLLGGGPRVKPSPSHLYAEQSMWIGEVDVATTPGAKPDLVLTHERRQLRTP